MEQILPIGSVIRAHNEKLFILGARMIEVEGKMSLAYLAVKYPRGYAGKESLGVVLNADIKEVIFRGNEGRSGKKHNIGLTQLYAAVEGKTSDEAVKMMQSVKTEE